MSRRHPTNPGYLTVPQALQEALLQLEAEWGADRTRRHFRLSLGAYTAAKSQGGAIPEAAYWELVQELRYLKPLAPLPFPTRAPTPIKSQHQPMILRRRA